MNEELEKIAQDMRRKERELWAGNPPRMGNGAVALMLDGYASRLEVALGLAPRPKCEAAAERDQAPGPSSGTKPGNGAAIHTALDSVRIEMLKRLAGIQPQISDMGILELCVDAQHKPVRNCDRFRTADEVSAYWGANVHAVPLHGDAYAMRIDGREFATFLDWLFASAEGGKK